MEHDPPLDPSLAAEIEGRVVEAAMTALGDHVIAIIAKGSAINGDFIPYFSDFDVHIYVTPRALRGERSLQPEFTMRFQAAVGDLDPEQFQVSQVQIIFVSPARYPESWTRPVPGTYRVVHGRLPDANASFDEATFTFHARTGLAQMDALTDSFLERIVDKPDDALPPIVRLMGTFLKPALRQAATVLGAPPIDVWTWSQAQVLELVEPEVIPDGSASAYFDKAQDWRVARSNAPHLRSMIEDALNAYEALTALSRRLD